MLVKVSLTELTPAALATFQKIVFAAPFEMARQFHTVRQLSTLSLDSTVR